MTTSPKAVASSEFQTCVEALVTFEIRISEFSEGLSYVCEKMLTKYYESINISLGRC
jgi:hypothetical protein